MQKKMEMDWPLSQNVKQRKCKGGSVLDARWEAKAWQTKGDLAKNSGKRDESKGLVVELFGNPGQGQKSMAVNG